MDLSDVRYGFSVVLPVRHILSSLQPAYRTERDNGWHVEHIIMQIEISGHYYDSVFFFDTKRARNNVEGREGGEGKVLIALGKELYVN